MKPLRRALVNIGKRDLKDKDRTGYYDLIYEQIYVVRAWFQRGRELEREIEETVEEETLHYVLHKRVSLEACRKLHYVLKGIEFKPLKVEEIPDFCEAHSRKR